MNHFQLNLIESVETEGSIKFKNVSITNAIQKKFKTKQKLFVVVICCKYSL